ncbi:MAG: hypothetical protein IKP21_06370 [Bacteroidales bacterium]|nr:hypothetical protein [Bacteroidales bacterium]
MKRWLYIALLMMPALAAAQEGIGHWRDCFDYTTVYHVVAAGERVYGSCRGGMYYFSPDDGSATGMGKATGLSDAGVATIAHDQATQCLVVAYDNANIDIIHNDRIYNISDIKRSEMAGNKSINHIRFHDGTAWLATGFGIAVLDLERHEIRETYYIGTGGAHTAVFDIAFTADSIYASTAEGLKSLAIDERFPGISDRWRNDQRLGGTTITELDTIGGTLLLATYTIDPEQLTLYRSNPSGYSVWASGEIKSMRSGGGMVCVATPQGVERYNAALQPIDTVRTMEWGPVYAFDAVTDNDGTLWIGHAWAGIVGIDTDGHIHGNIPQGPAAGDNAYRLVPTLDGMLLCPGGHSSTYAAAGIEPNMFYAEGHSWEGLDLSNGALAGQHDLLDAAVNPKDTSEIVAALWGCGVVSIRNKKVQEFYNDTTTGVLQSYTPDGIYHTLLTGSVAFDRAGNLWVLNSHSRYALAVRRTDGTWEHFATDALSSLLQVDKLIYDSINNWLWFAGRDNAIYVHDGEGRMARINPNRGSKLETEFVNTIVQDRSGNIWIGTNKGIKVIYDTYNAFKNGGHGEESPVSCSNITITNGSFAEYLMAYENITTIAVDGANRKWVGTATGGLYLISANGLEQIEHFTASESPLYSDKIICIGIQPRSGEVYIGSVQGLQVYRGTATFAETMPQEHIYAFPNPVRPGYDGPVAIKGFTRDALVHITDAAGHVVYSTQAHGGQVVWKTRTASGTPVASGVYYVFASDAMGSNRSVAKILIIR